MNYPRILFLDFDGVLVRPSLVAGAANPECVAYLNHIIARTGAAIVVSSSWRMGIVTPAAAMRQQLQLWGVAGVVLGCTPDLSKPVRGIQLAHSRGDEIQDWLDDHSARFNVDRFVILDDQDPESLRDRWVATSYTMGLTAADAERAIALLEGV